MGRSRFARALKKARTDAGLTQSQLGVAIAVDPNTIARLERGENGASRRVLEALRARFPDVEEFMTAADRRLRDGARTGTDG